MLNDDIVARKIVEAHSGSIHVYSEGEIDQGSTFYVDIPVTNMQERIDDAKSQLSANLTPELKSFFSAEKSMIEPELLDIACVNRSIESILIVDDSLINRKMIKRLLQGKCKRIDEAGDGKEAIIKVNDFCKENGAPYDVIMMDFVMPVMNGPDCVRELRKSGFKGLIIGVTGNAMKTDLNIFMEAGTNKVMTKPLDTDIFMKSALG